MSLVHFGLFYQRFSFKMSDLQFVPCSIPDESIGLRGEKAGRTLVRSPASKAAGPWCGQEDFCLWWSASLFLDDGPPKEPVVPILVSCEPDLSDAGSSKLYEVTQRLFQPGDESECDGNMPARLEGPRSIKNLKPAQTSHLELEAVQQPVKAMWLWRYSQSNLYILSTNMSW